MQQKLLDSKLTCMLNDLKSRITEDMACHVAALGQTHASATRSGHLASASIQTIPADAMSGKGWSAAGEVGSELELILARHAQKQSELLLGMEQRIEARFQVGIMSLAFAIDVSEGVSLDDADDGVKDNGSEDDDIGPSSFIHFAHPSS